MFCVFHDLWCCPARFFHGSTKYFPGSISCHETLAAAIEINFEVLPEGWFCRAEMVSLILIIMHYNINIIIIIN